MAINEWKIWQKLGLVKPKEEVIDVDKDLAAITVFLKESTPVIKQLSILISDMKRLRKKEKQWKKLKNEKQLRDNVLQQVKTYDKILRQYEFLELDTDVNGERIKKISHNLGKKAKEINIDKKWLDIIRKSERWTFNW